MVRLCVIALGVIFILSCESRHPGNYPDYDSTLQIHLKAIKDRDLTTILYTVHDSVELIFPNGQILKSKSAFGNFHKEWFADQNWLMQPGIVKSVKSDSISYSLIRYKYHDIDSVGSLINPRETYLMLVFKLEAEGWKLIHDQNTRIQTD